MSEEVLLDAAEEGYDGVVGPSKDFEAPLLEEDENGQIVESGYAKSFVVVDLGDSCLAQIKDYDPVVDTAVFPFEETMPASLPRVVDVIQGVFDWIEATTLSRVHFYSAREEQTVPALPKRSTPKKVSNAALVEQLTNLAAQVQMIGEQQKLLSQAVSPAAARSSADPVGVPLAGGALMSRLPNVSNGLDLMMSTPKKATALLGPPPKTKAVGTPLTRAAPLEEDEPKDIAEEKTTAEGSILGALASQSTAITALVAHLAGGGDAMQDLSSSGSQHLALSSRGVGRREKMRAELANRSSNYFLAVQQQMYRRMNPAKVVPKTLEELGSSGVSMTGYLERYGGYKNAKDAGLSLWVAAHAMDCAAEGDFVGTREYLALLCAALEQSALDGSWSLAWVLTLLDDPPTMLFADRMQPVVAHGKPFAPLGSPDVGSNIASLSSRDRGPHYAEDGGEGFEASRIQGYDRGCRGGEGPFTSKASQVSQEAKGCAPGKGAMKFGEVFCMDNGGGGFSSAGDVQVEVPVQPSPVGDATTFKHGTTIPPPKTRTDGQQLTYPKWCALLVSNVLKTRTSFASYLNKSIFLSQAKTRFGLAPTFFPIPLPPGDHFDRMPANLSQHRRRMFHLKRAVHTLCMALNFWYSGGSFADVELLQREPNDQHRCLYGRLAALIRSEGLTQPFPVAKSGRKFPNLIARLGELSDVLMKQGAVDPYTKSFAGGDFTLDEETSGCLSPYRDLDPSRLALHGCGNWDATAYLSDYLVMAYREPRVLLTGLEAGVRPAVRDPPEKIGELARKWDANNLLMVHDEPVHPDSFVKIFNCYKNATTDRQIGDRRGQNSLESRLLGPSRELPGGADVQDMVADARSQKLCLSVTDRRDFYHQLFATRSRAVSNTVGPGVPWSMLEGTKGYANYLLASSKKKKASQEARGDFLGSYGWPPSQRSCVRPDEGLLWTSFCSVLQGDHGGVEICTDAHVSLLQSHGLLDANSRLVSSKPLLSSSVADGLVIDDYFCISREDATTPNGESVAFARYEASQAAYREHGLLGSPQKDVLAENGGKAIGAYVNSSERARSRGFITVASPPEKRLSLSFLTLQACALSHTTDSLHLCIVGGWVSVLNYRRPLMSLMGKCFHVVDAATYDPNEPKVVPLSRSVANQLVLLAALAPLALHEISARYDPDVYATDASNTMGGICKARVGEEVVETLWRHCKSKGAYTRLLSQAEVLMRRLELHEEGRDEPTINAVQRPLAYSFDFIEVFAGSAKVTTYVAQLGVAVGPPIELS